MVMTPNKELSFNDINTTDAAYAMVNEYMNGESLGPLAIERVEKETGYNNKSMLIAMWKAIDAYVDINGEL